MAVGFCWHNQAKRIGKKSAQISGGPKVLKSLNTKAFLDFILQKHCRSLFLIIAISQFGSTSALAETPHGAPMLGVSSAWTGGAVNEAHPSKKSEFQHPASQKQVSTVLTSKQPLARFQIPSNGRAEIQTAHNETRTPNKSNLFIEKAFESILDSWQISLKHLYADAAPRFTTFSKWASGKLGFSKANTVPNLNMANTPAVINVNLQPVSSNHNAWLMSDGRLKTVTAH